MQKSIDKINQLHKKTFLVLVCGHDGVICIEYKKLKTILDENYGIIYSNKNKILVDIDILFEIFNFNEKIVKAPENSWIRLEE